MRAIYICLLLLGSSRAYALSMSDISMLLPLPGGAADVSALLHPDDRGARGPLLGEELKELFRKSFPYVGPNDINENWAIENFAVVAIRLDPCFRDARGDCRPQVRLSWENVLCFKVSCPEPSPYLLAPPRRFYGDSLLHTSYDLSAESFGELVRDLGKLAASYGQGPVEANLQIQPRIAAEGYRGRYWSQFRALLLSKIGAELATRFTFINPSNAAWTFGGFERNEAGWAPLPIPGVKTPNQLLWNMTSGIFNSIPDELDSLANFLAASWDGLRQEFAAQPALREPTLDRLYRIENPRRHSARDIDCVSCHIAQNARLWLLERFPGASPGNPNQYGAAEGALANPSPLFGDSNIHAFSWYDGRAHFSQRVINETAEALKIINEQSHPRQ